MRSQELREGRPDAFGRYHRADRSRGRRAVRPTPRAHTHVERGALIERGLSIRQLLPYVLSHAVSTAIVGISTVSHLEENVRVASEFQPLTEEQMAAIRTAAQRRPSP